MKFTWVGTFTKVGKCNSKKFILKSEGNSIEEMRNIIKDFVEAKNSKGYALIENELTDIKL